MRNSLAWRGVLAAALIWQAQSSPASAQKPPRSDVIVRESVDVRLINLDAIVTNRDDTPVVDLQAEDFDLRVDGQSVKITHVAQGRELRETIAGRLTLVLFIDDRHLENAQRDAALLEVERALETEMSENPTWVAVTTFGEGLVAVQPPTRDFEAVRQALAAVRAGELGPTLLRELQRTTSNEVKEMLRRLTRSGMSYRTGEVSKASVLTGLESYGKALAVDTRETLAAAESLVQALSFVPGRKAVLFVSGGLPRQPLDRIAKTLYDRLAGGSRLYEGDGEVEIQGTFHLNDLDHLPTGSERFDRGGGGGVQQHGDGGAMRIQIALANLECTSHFDRLAALSNTHRVTFYPLRPPVLDSSQPGLGDRKDDNDSIALLSDMRSGLQDLAADTGGLAFVGESGIADFLEQTRFDLSAYYSLGFEPPDSMSGTAIREMDLKVRRRRTRLRYRASYVPLSLEQRLSNRAWGTLLFGWQENLHGVEVKTTVGTRDEVGYPIEVMLSLPIGKLTLVPSHRIATGSFRLVLQLQRDDGARMEPEHISFVVQIPAEELKKAKTQFFAVRAGLRVRRGRYRMAVGLWEENSASTSYVVHPIDVGVSDFHEEA